MELQWVVEGNWKDRQDTQRNVYRAKSGDLAYTVDRGDHGWRVRGWVRGHYSLHRKGGRTAEAMQQIASKHADRHS